MASTAVVQPAPARALPDGAIEGVLQRAFAPHRCYVKFQMDAFVGNKKIALIIYASRAGCSVRRPFIVEGVSVDDLRRRDALLSYIDDVREQLERHKIAFAVGLGRLLDVYI